MSDRHTIRVPAEGPIPANIMILGESPGARELEQGRPFVGPAGKEQDSLLEAVGLKRSDIYITNVVKTLPTEPKEEFFFDRTGKGRGAQLFPTSAYMEGICEVVEEIRRVKPNVIVPVGNYALWALTQKSGILRWRGSILESTLVPGQKVIPTIHPAWFLHGRQWHQFILCEWDWQRIVEESKTPEISLPKATFITSPDPVQIEEAVQRFLEAEMLSVDTEWFSPENLAYIGFSDCEDYAVCIPATTMDAYRAYKRLLGSSVPKLMQNAAFDAVALARVGIKVSNIVDDTMLAFNACWSDIGKKGLDVQASVLTRWPFYKDDVEFVGKDDEKGQEYCCTDCVVTWQAMNRMQSHEFRPDVAGGSRGYELSMLNMQIFIDASIKGIRTSREKILELKKGYLDTADQIEAVVSQAIGRTINCRSWQQVQKAVYDDLGIGKKRKERSTEQEVLMDIAASEKDPQIKALLTAIIRVRQNRNIVSRYVNLDIVDRDERIRTNWNLAGTRNGRYSTSDPWWNGVAMQTVPGPGAYLGGARELFMADPDCIFVGWDLAQAEARDVAVRTRDYDLLDSMGRGTDIHIKLAVDMGIFDMTYEEIVKQCKDVGKDKSPPRVLCKVCRHASNYYLTGRGLKLRINKDYLDTGVGVTEAEAYRIHDRYIELHSGLEAWWEEVFQELKSRKYLTNALGRRRNFLGRWQKFDHTHRDAIAFGPQSDIADITTISIHEADKLLKRIDPQAQCFAHMHDGGFFQVREECKDEALDILQGAMTREFPLGRELLTIPAEVKWGYNWRDMG